MDIKYVTVNKRKRKRLFKNCCVCGKEFHVQPSKAKRVQSCPDCRDINRKPPATLNCEYCGNEFTVKGYLGDVQKYCSLECKWDALCADPAKSHRHMKPRKCENCNEIFEPTLNKKLHCSAECALEASRRRDYICDYCGKRFNKKRRSNYTHTYCSKKCKGKHQRGENHVLWVDKEIDGLDYRSIQWKEVAEGIRKRDKYCCQRCGVKQTPSRALDVHHIEPYRISQNNHPDNLITLCASCHKLVEHSPELLNAENSEQS